MKNKKHITGILLFLFIILLSFCLPMREIEEFVGILAIIILFITVGSSMHSRHKILGDNFSYNHRTALKNEQKQKPKDPKLIFYGGILLFALLASIVINRLVYYI